MRRVLFAAAAAFAMTCGAAHAAGIIDPVADFLPSYVGPHLADLDVIAFGVTYNAPTTTFHLYGAMAGTITPGTSGFYVIGVDRGGSGPSPFVGIGAGNVIFNRTIAIQKTGVTTVGGATLAALISGATFNLDVPLSLLPSTGFTPNQYASTCGPAAPLATPTSRISPRTTPTSQPSPSRPPGR